MILLLTLGLLGVSGAIISEVFQDNKQERARFAAESLALQLSTSSLRPEGKFDSPGRGPASNPESVSTQLLNGVNGVNGVNGEISHDPWGHAYHYRISRADDGHVTEVLVWSDGPNAQAETNFDRRTLDGKMFSFGGDDIGYLLRPKPQEM